jgi:hypothetical protein
MLHDACCVPPCLSPTAVGDPSKDFTLLVELSPLDALQKAAAGEGGGRGAMGIASGADGYGVVSVQQCRRGDATKTVALATFVPAPASTPAPTAESNGAPHLAPLHTELILIVDGSGSMSGTPIEQVGHSVIAIAR